MVQKKYQSKKMVSQFGNVALSHKAMAEAGMRNSISKECFDNIAKLNTQRAGLKGFVFENLHAKEMNYELMKKGLKAEVIDNNGIADIVVRDMKTGKVVERIQTKCGYETAPIDAAKYVEDGQTIVINGDADKAAKSLDNQGIEYKKSKVTDKTCKKMSDKMKNESKITKSRNAKVVSKTEHFKEVAKNSHRSGLNAAKNGALFGAGMSLGSNFVEVISGDKDFEEAAIDVAKDTAISGVTGYVTGVAGSALASTATGATVIAKGAAIAGTVTGTATTAAATIAGVATATGTAIAGTAVGSAAIATGAAVTGAATAAGAAVAGAATATGAAIAGTAVGGAAIATGAAVTGAATAAGAAIAGTAVGGAAIAGAAAVGAAAVAAAPVVAVGAAVGLAFTGIKKLFDW